MCWTVFIVQECKFAKLQEYYKNNCRIGKNTNAQENSANLSSSATERQLLQYSEWKWTMIVFLVIVYTNYESHQQNWVPSALRYTLLLWMI